VRAWIQNGPGGPPLDHTNLTTGLWSYDKADPERKSSLLAWEDALERAGARYLYDKRGRKREVSLNVFEIAADGVLQRRKLTYLPVALLNADHWKKAFKFYSDNGSYNLLSGLRLTRVFRAQ
jgi:hypothetical protein